MNPAETGATPERRRLSDTEIAELAAKVNIDEAISAGVADVLREAGHGNQVGFGVELPIAVAALQTKLIDIVTLLINQGNVSLNVENFPGSTQEEKIRNFTKTLAISILG